VCLHALPALVCLPDYAAVTYSDHMLGMALKKLDGFGEAVVAKTIVLVSACSA